MRLMMRIRKPYRLNGASAATWSTESLTHANSGSVES
jgi:hypothetical protein